jgi:threonine dehydrogenase-like Zn-dependent dehydrogenase
MKAVSIFEHGGTDVLRYEDFQMPQMSPTDVLVKVLSTTPSWWDIKYRNDKSAFSLPGRKPFASEGAIKTHESSTIFRNSDVSCFRCVADRLRATFSLCACSCFLTTAVALRPSTVRFST